MTVTLTALTDDTPRPVLDRLDEILRDCRGELIGPGDRLETALERACDADDRRILWWASLGGNPVGLIDALLHYPEPTDLTVQQLAVSPTARFRGVARSLVQATVRDAARRGIPSETTYAAVLPDAVGAAAFWSALGFDESLGHPDLLCAPSDRVGALAP